MNRTQQFLCRVDEVTQFCLASRGPCFNGWTREKVFLYVGFHSLAGTIFVIRKSDHSIQSVGFGWPATFQGVAQVFSWKPTAPGHALFIAEVIGDRSSAGRMFRMAMKRWPKVKRFFTYRREHLVEIKPGALMRFAHE